MYALDKFNITKIKRAFKNRSPNPFEFDEVNNPPKKPKLFSKPKHLENLGLDVYHDLKVKDSYFDGVVDNGLTVTKVEPEEPKELTPLQRMLESLDLNGQYFIFGKLDEYKRYLLAKDLNFWVNVITEFNQDFENFVGKANNTGNEFNYYNNLIHSFLYEFSGNVSMEKYVGSKQLEIYKLIDDYLSSFVLMMDRITVVKNFLICCKENKKGYIINNVTKKEVVTERVNRMKTVNGKNRTERMINKPLKYMGLVVKDSSSNKHMYAEIETGDFNKYAYFQVFEQPHQFQQTLPSGKKIDKLVFHIDNFDDGKGHDAIFVPAGMSLELVNGDVSEPYGYLVAFERNQGNNEIIKKLEALNDGCDSVVTLTTKTIEDLKYHY